MLATVFAFFGISDWSEANRVTLFEYRIRNRGHIMELYLQAFLNRAVKATTRDGKKYTFQKFGDFYDEKKRWNKRLGKSHSVPVNENLIAIAKRMQKYEEKGGY